MRLTITDQERDLDKQERKHKARNTITEIMLTTQRHKVVRR